MKHFNLIVLSLLLLFTGQVYAGDAMVLVFDTQLSSGTTVTLPLHGTVDVTVDWGDGTSEQFTTDGNRDHTYATDGEYEVSITGTLTHFGNDHRYPKSYSNSDKILKIKDFGNLGITSLHCGFYGASNLNEVTIDLPIIITDLSYAFAGNDQDSIVGLAAWDVINITNMRGLFYYSNSFNQDISHWTVDNVSDMSMMFEGASKFNQNIGIWSVDNAINMSGMFMHTNDFDQDLNSWNVINVTDMTQMFRYAKSFNSNIGSWKVDNVSSMEYMFFKAQSFNQNISNWNVSKVRDMSNMFEYADSFNQIIGNWKVHNVTDMSSMFEYTDFFNQDLTNWDVSKVTDMSRMFYSADVFNGDLSNWRPASAIDMSHMFYSADSFNQDIGNWDVGKVTDMSNMFKYTKSFNQDISNWNISNVTDMTMMFCDADLFDQNIGDWNISKVTSMSSMFCNTKLSTQNYNYILINWSEREELPNNISFGGGLSSYSSGAAASAKEQLETEHNWTISDAGEIRHAATILQDIGSITATSAIGTAAVLDYGSLDPEHYGLCWSTTERPTTTDNKTDMGGTYRPVTFNSILTNLTPGQTYYVRPYTSNTLGTYYGNQISFTTLSEDNAFTLLYNIGSASYKKTITLPLYGSVDVTVDWGDGTTDHYTTTGDKDHRYSNEGIYTVTITGTLTEFGHIFNYNNTRLIKVVSFGNIGLESLSSAFRHADDLDEVPRKLPTTITSLSSAFSETNAIKIDGLESWDVSSVTNMASMFSSALNFNQDISKWDVSKVTNMAGMFYGARYFNQDISNWDVGSVTSMYTMFEGATLSTSNYNSLLISWANLQNISNDVVFSGGNSTYSYGVAENARNKLESVNNWSITDGNATNFSAILTNAPSHLGLGSATLHGTITELGVSNPTQHGFCWIHRGTPTIDDHIIELGPVSEAGDFSAMLSGRSPYSTYYYRAYAINNAGITYGETKSFSPKHHPVVSLDDTSLLFREDHEPIQIDPYAIAQHQGGESQWPNSILSVSITENAEPEDQISIQDNVVGTINTDGVNLNYGSITFGTLNVPEGTISNNEILSILFNDYATTELIQQTIRAFHFVTTSQSPDRTITITISDYKESEAIDTRIVSITERDNNPPEIVNNRPLTLIEGENTAMLSDFLSATDIEVNDESLKFTITSIPINGTLYKSGIPIILNGTFLMSDLTDGNITYEHDGSNTTQDSFEFTVSDGTNDLTGQIFNISVVNPMILEFDTQLSDGTTITLPLQGTVDLTVDWGDGNSEHFTTAGYKDHTYDSERIYEVRISGSLTHFGIIDKWPAQYPNIDKLIKVKDFGSLDLVNLRGAFYIAANLDEVPENIPNTITNLAYTFSGIRKDTIIGLAGWDVKNVTNMECMFCLALNFNQDIGSWNVGNVTNMSSMFRSARSFNQDIGNWNVRNVTNMADMFFSTFSFNQDIGNWDVSNTINMDRMFYKAEIFNQNIKDWNVENVEYMHSMFYKAHAFNQNIGNWDVGKVTTMNSMFYQAYAFNQNIGNWDVRKVNDMSYMFSVASSFNQDIGEWDVSSVTDMSWMLADARSFNQDIEVWNVSNVTNMQGMFYQTPHFNQNIGNWVVSKVTNMYGMFWNASSFNQDLGAWDVSNVTDMTYMFLNITLSPYNYSSLLKGWASLDNGIVNGVTFNGGNSKYYRGSAADARQQIESNYNWTIDDGGWIEYTLNISLNDATLNYTANDRATQIDQTATITHTGTDREWNTGTLTVKITGNAEANDQLTIEDNIVGTLHTSGTDLKNGSTIIGSLSAIEGTVTNDTELTITFNNNITTELVQQTVRAIHYGSISSTPELSDRTITFNLSDVQPDTSIDSRIISITAPNNPPILSLNNSLSLFEEAIETITSHSHLAVTDVDNDDANLEFTVTTVPGHGTLNKSGSPIALNGTFLMMDLTNGNITYEHNGSNTTQDHFEFNVSDGLNELTEQTYSITIIPVDDDAPTMINNSPLTLIEEDIATITHNLLSATDTEADDALLTFTITTAPEYGTIINDGIPLAPNDAFLMSDVSNGMISYLHDGTNTTEDSFEFTVSDGVNELTNQTYSITITPVDDDAPTIVNNNPIILLEEVTAPITHSFLSATDTEADDETLEFIVTTLPEHGMLNKSGSPVVLNGIFIMSDLTDGYITYEHNGSNTTQDYFEFTVSDGANDLTDQTYAINITPIDDDAPSMVNNNPLILDEGETTTITNTLLSVTDTEANDETLEFIVNNLPEHGSLNNLANPIALNGTFLMSDITNGYITYEHDGSNTTQDYFEFTVSDGTNDLTDQTCAINITPIDDDVPSMVHNNPLILDEGETTTITNTLLSVTDTEANDETLELIVNNLPEYGTLNKLGAPIQLNDTFLMSDLSVGSITYEHDGSNTTDDSFEFTVSDGSNTLTGQTYSITIIAVDDDAPIITMNTGITLDNKDTVAILNSSLAADDTEADDTTLLFIVTTAPTNGALENSDNAGIVISSFTQQHLIDGKIQYIHDGNATTIDSFIFKVSDTNNELVDQDFSITINTIPSSSSSISPSSSAVSSSDYSSVESSSSVEPSSSSSSTALSSSIALSNSSIELSSSITPVESSTGSGGIPQSSAAIQASSSNRAFSSNSSTEGTPTDNPSSEVSGGTSSVASSSSNAISILEDQHDFTHFGLEPLKVTIYTVMGKKVQTRTLAPGESLGRYMYNLSQGLYVMRYFKNGKAFYKGYFHR
ncbi:MAG: BspA family leucine-rich repeat surface protein [Fibrobacterales bacterium]